MLSLNKGKNPSEDPCNSQNTVEDSQLDSSMDTTTCSSGKVADEKTGSSLNLISFELNSDGPTDSDPEKELIVSRCLEDLDQLLRKRHKVATLKFHLGKASSANLPTYMKLNLHFSPSLDADANKYMQEKLGNLKMELTELFITKMMEICDEYTESLLSDISLLLQCAETKIGRANAESGQLLRKLTNQVKDKKDIWHERYLKAIRNMPRTSSKEEEKPNENPIAKLQDELKELRNLLEPNRFGRGGRRNAFGRRPDFSARRQKDRTSYRDFVDF